MCFRDHGNHFEHHRGGNHGGDLVRVILGRHQTDNIAANNIHAADSMQKRHRLIDTEAANTQFDIRHRRGNCGIKAVEVKGNIDRPAASVALICSITSAAPGAVISHGDTL